MHIWAWRGGAREKEGKLPPKRLVYEVFSTIRDEMQSQQLELLLKFFTLCEFNRKLLASEKLNISIRLFQTISYLPLPSQDWQSYDFNLKYQFTCIVVSVLFTSLNAVFSYMGTNNPYLDPLITRQKSPFLVSVISIDL